MAPHEKGRFGHLGAVRVEDAREAAPVVLADVRLQQRHGGVVARLHLARERRGRVGVRPGRRFD